MLRVHLLQNWFGYSDPAMEEALYEVAPLRRFARLSLRDAIPDETTLLNFRHLLERNDLASKMLTAVNADLEPVRYRGLAKNGAQARTLFALSNLWMAQRHPGNGSGDASVRFQLSEKCAGNRQGFSRDRFQPFSCRDQRGDRVTSSAAAISCVVQTFPGAAS